MTAGASELVLVPSAVELQLLGLTASGSGGGAFGDGRAAVARCGVGPVVAAVETGRHLQAVRPSRAWLVGLAGTRDPARAPLAAVVVGRAVRDEAVGAGHGEAFLDLVQMGLAGPGHPPPDDLPPLLPLHVPETLQSGTEGAGAVAGTSGTGASGPVVGVVGTVASASGDPREAAARARRHPDVLVEEMEGYAVAVACARAGVPLVVLRGVANAAGDRDRRSWRARDAATALRAVLDAALDAVRGATP